MGSKKLSQNLVSSSFDNPPMDKDHQEKCYLDKCLSDIWHMLKMTQETYFSRFFKIGAKILLIWTIVARTNAAWTNVTMTVGIFKTWSTDTTFKVWSKSS